MMVGVLNGVVVLDMTRVIAGPLAGQTLGDFGADVIKVERRDGGDDTRGVGPPWMRDTEGRETADSTYFQSVNRNKRSITLDFTLPEGADLLRRLAARADVVLENYRPGTLARYGLGYDDLRQVNPRLIYCSLTGFGQTGPYSDRSGYDFLAQAMGGLMDMTGHPDGEPGGGPMRVGVPVVDILSGMNAVIGVLLSLQHREHSGVGQHIDISLFDTQLASMLNPLVAWLNSRDRVPRTGNHHPSATPYGMFPAADGFIVIATFTSREFARVTQALEHPEWASDPRFETPKARAANRHLLIAELSAVLSRRSRAEWVKRLNDFNISCGPLNTVADLDTDPHVQKRGMIVDVPHPLRGTIRLPASPVRMSETPAHYLHSAPEVGQHTGDVLYGLLDMDTAAIDALHQRGVI